MSEITIQATMATATGLKAFNSMIQSPKTQNYLQDVLGERKAGFVNNVVALVANSENLQQCENQSILYSAIKATALDLPLDPNLGFAYVIPYWDKKARVQKAQFQIGYQGWKQLAIRSGQVIRLNATDVREGELISEDLLTGEVVIRRTENRESKKIIGYAAYLELKNGYKATVYRTREWMEDHALRFTKQKEDGKLGGVWASDFDAMARKTVIKIVLKDAPLSTDMKTAIESDKEVEAMAPATNIAAKNIQEAEVITMDAEPQQTEQVITAPSEAQMAMEF